MIRPANQPSEGSRRIVCSGCGAEFDCSLAGPCWCTDESFRLPMPVDGGDCLCPDCLRQAASGAATTTAT
nr:cysteine-rich CWC family protein [Bradyrhizobium sp. dw_78]